MVWLVLGVFIWSVAHASRSGAPGLRAAFIARLGEGPYRGLFSLKIIASVVLMVIGWRSATPAVVYRPPAWGADAALLLMFAALVLFAASGVPTNIKRFIRHPQLSGVALWSLAHLLANGDDRSLVLFGTLGAWALVEMPLINRREGAWRRPQPLPLGAEIKPLVGAAIAFAILILAHPYLFGVAPLRF